MLIGSSTSHLLRIITSAAADIEVGGSLIAIDTATPPVVQGGGIVPVILASITTATTTTIVTGATSTIKRVMELSVRNNHASTTCDVEITREDGTNTIEVIKATLLAGEVLIYNGASTWLHYDANGALYPSVGNAATQGDQETATANNKYVSPSVQHFHPSAAKFWYRVTVSAGTPTLANSYNITSITDTATGQLTVTIATDFSGVNYAIVTAVERSSTTTTVASARDDDVRNATVAAGSFIHECWDKAATNNALADPSTWYGVGFGDL